MSKSNFQIKRIAIAAVLTAIGVILKSISITTPFFRISVFDASIILSGLLLGPVYGLLIGFMVDVIDFQLFPKGFPFSFTIMFGTMFTGFIPGLISFIHYKIKKDYNLNFLILILTIIAATFSAFSMTTLYFYMIMGMGFLKDLPTRITIMLADDQPGKIGNCLFCSSPEND